MLSGFFFALQVSDTSGDLSLPSDVDVSVPFVGGLLPDLPGGAFLTKADVNMPPSSMPSVSGLLPDLPGDAVLPKVDVNVPTVSADIPSVKGENSCSLPRTSGEVDAPSVDAGMPSGPIVFDTPSIDLAGKVLDMPSVEGGISGDLMAADVKVAAPDVDANMESGATPVTTSLAVGAVAGLGAIGAGIGLMGKGDKPEGEVRYYIR